MSKKDEFSKVFKNEIKEVISKERKYDSFFDEHKRIKQFGRTYLFQTDKPLKNLFIEIISFSFKSSNFLINDDDLYKLNVIHSKDKKSKLKIVDFKNDENETLKISMQTPIQFIETRTTIELKRRNKNVELTFVLFFKKETPFYGMRDFMITKKLKKDFNEKFLFLKNFIDNRKKE